MRLAILVEFFPPRLGSDRRIFEIMSRLSKKHEIHFVVLPPFRALSSNFEMGNRELESHVRGTKNLIEFDGIKAHYIQIAHWLTWLWRRSYKIAYLLTMIALLPKVSRCLKEIDPDAVVLNYPSVYTGILGFFAAKIIRRPVTLDFNDLIAQYSIMLLNLSETSLAARLFVYAQDFLVRNCNTVVATTNLIREYAVKRGASLDRLFIVPNGVDTKFFSPEAGDEQGMKSKFGLNGKTICLYGGRLDNWAGIDILIGLCKELTDDKPDTRFLIVGGQLKSQECPRNLVVIGETPFNAMPEILSAADAILVPFPANLVSHATSPLKLFEGMAMQKPVIASNVGGIAEIVTHGINGVLVDNPNSIRKWREAVELILNSRAFARRLAKEARFAAVQKYDWHHLAEEYEKIFIS